ncbi:hypothetical protein [uncultured Brachyspira sp.]|uniref:hypothetical protein n=1 Tax=uncultured Brachyspira sp. TaxID=221953 RepID=UPI002634F862|nr:hypothetical protein [uncultured Brachyspira sp.]
MKKFIIFIFILFNISILYANDNFKISDNSLKLLRDAGIEIKKDQLENIKLIVNKYSYDAKILLKEIKDIDFKISKEYERDEINLKNIKELIYEKKRKEADFDYLIMSCDLDILELFSDTDIKKIKYYIIFQK